VGRGGPCPPPRTCSGPRRRVAVPPGAGAELCALAGGRGAPPGAPTLPRARALPGQAPPNPPDGCSGKQRPPKGSCPGTGRRRAGPAGTAGPPPRPAASPRPPTLPGPEPERGSLGCGFTPEEPSRVGTPQRPRRQLALPLPPSPTASKPRGASSPPHEASPHARGLALARGAQRRSASADPGQRARAARGSQAAWSPRKPHGCVHHSFVTRPAEPITPT